ncbi:CRAL/TRIO domain [Popillia japonica]|uniref:CRAL/TRIO domain n=1 Tax=Popillia japonica TaxID=7064 RepID=A0AAW1N246_POPJA
MGKFQDIEVEYEKNKELTKEDVNLLKDWMEKQPHLPKISEFQIIIFLHSCYYKIEPTKTCIETFLVAPLKKKTHDGYQIIYCKFFNTDANKFVFSDAVKVFDMVILLMLHQLGTAPGYLILGDLAGISFGHMTKFLPTHLMKFFLYFQEALPIRLKGLLFINIPPFMDKLMALLKPFMKKELLSCLKLYTNNFDELYKTIPRDCFPDEYGGEAGTTDELVKIWKENLIANTGFFVEDEELIADESKRVEKSRNDENIFGMQGTYRRFLIAFIASDSAVLPPEFNSRILFSCISVLLPISASWKMSRFATAEEEYEKNPELRKEDVEAVQDWVSKQNHLPPIDELEIILFLHSCYYRIEPTKTCIDNFYTIRTLCPEFFANRDPRTNPAETLNLLLYAPLPKLTREGYKVIFAKLIDPNPDNYTFAGQVKVFDMATMLALHQGGTHNGVVVVTDMKEVTFSHFTKLGVVHIKKFFYYLQHAMPVRIKGLHFLNIPIFMDKIVGLIKPFMKGELFQVLYLHTDKLDTLYKYVPKECLPRDYGGDMDSVQNLIKIQNKNILENAQYFVEDEKRIVDESKRDGKPKSDNDIFGVGGGRETNRGRI